MTRTKLHELAELGQSVWLDYIKRSFITSGGLGDYVQKGLSGVTSNPSLFQKAIAEGDEYDDQIRKLALEGKTTQEIYEQLAIDDVRLAADILHQVYEESLGMDGYVSLEVNPRLAHDKDGQVEEAKRLFEAVDQPNVMIKVPATAEGILAFHELTAAGVNINVTLMFSLLQYDMVAEAYISAMEKRVASLDDLHKPASVASIFVSRVDTKVDKLLNETGTPAAEALKGKIGIANAKMVYQHYFNTFHGQRWNYLAEQGARIQRVLYGSTSTKNPEYRDVMYVENLIGLDTINTVPPETLEAFLEHGTVGLTLDQDIDVAYEQLDRLAKLGIDLNEVTRQVLDEGIQKFVEPYDKLIETIAQKQADFITA